LSNVSRSLEYSTIADVKIGVSRNLGVEDKVKHRTLIIHGLASKLRGELEELTGWEVVAGPIKSSQVRSFLKTFSKGKKPS